MSRRSIPTNKTCSLTLSSLLYPLVLSAFASLSLPGVVHAWTHTATVSLASPLTVMSMPLQPRRTARQTEPRRHFADEQAWHRQQQEEAREIQRALAEAAATEEPSDSSEDELPYEQRPDPDEERKANPARENTPPWSRDLHNVHPPVCTALPIATLPRNRVRTELGFLQCFTDPPLIHFVTNTNLYAAARQAVAWADTTTEEM